MWSGTWTQVVGSEIFVSGAPAPPPAVKSGRGKGGGGGGRGDASAAAAVSANSRAWKRGERVERSSGGGGGAVVGGGGGDAGGDAGGDNSEGQGKVNVLGVARERVLFVPAVAVERRKKSVEKKAAKRGGGTGEGEKGVGEKEGREKESEVKWSGGGVLGENVGASASAGAGARTDAQGDSRPVPFIQRLRAVRIAKGEIRSGLLPPPPRARREGEETGGQGEEPVETAFQERLYRLRGQHGRPGVEESAGNYDNYDGEDASTTTDEDTDNEDDDEEDDDDDGLAE